MSSKVRSARPDTANAAEAAPITRAHPFVVATRSLGHRWVRRLTRQSHDGGVRRPAPPPTCPPGWQIGPPDFVGVGAQRCGTTRWFRLIASHPEVASSPADKELHFFDRFYGGGFAEADVAAYHAYFPRPAGAKAGEWTPLYGSSAWIPKLLSRAAPDARLLVLLRDPIERFVSALQHNARLSHEQGMPLNRLAPVEAFRRGFYHAEIEALSPHFDRSRILVLQYERCAREPLEQLRRTFEFIGLADTRFAPSELDANPNPQSSKPQLDEEARDSYARAYRDDVEALARAFPEIDLALWPNFAELAG
ncbi:MAG TPA: sulfotransferase [Solirubrobacterales bacterium]